MGSDAGARGGARALRSSLKRRGDWGLYVNKPPTPSLIVTKDTLD